MRSVRPQFQWMMILMVIFLIAACDSFKSPTGTNDMGVAESDEATIDFRRAKNENSGNEINPDTWVVEKMINYCGGGVIMVDNLFQFRVFPKSMNPSKNTVIKARIELTADGALEFHFEPSGLCFEPFAELTLLPNKLTKIFGDQCPLNPSICLNWWNPETREWELISTQGLDDNPANMNSTKIFTIENAQAIEYRWNQNGSITLYIPHFSLYSLSKR